MTRPARETPQTHTPKINRTRDECHKDRINTKTPPTNTTKKKEENSTGITKIFKKERRYNTAG
jgi:hypothetical protein